MAATETVIKNQCSLMINLGTTQTGATKLGPLSLGTLSATAADWDAQKAVNIATALGDCLENTFVELRHVATSRVEAA